MTHWINSSRLMSNIRRCYWAPWSHHAQRHNFCPHTNFKMKSCDLPLFCVFTSIYLIVFQIFVFAVFTFSPLAPVGCTIVYVFQGSNFRNPTTFPLIILHGPLFNGPPAECLSCYESNAFGVGVLILPCVSFGILDYCVLTRDVNSAELRITDIKTCSYFYIFHCSLRLSVYIYFWKRKTI